MKIRSLKYFVLSTLLVFFSLPIAAQDFEDFEKSDATKGAELLEQMANAIIKPNADFTSIKAGAQNTVYNSNAPGGKISRETTTTINFKEDTQTTNVSMPQGNLTIELNSGKAVMKMMGQERPLPGPQAKQMQASISRHYLNISLNADSYDAEYMGIEEYDGKTYDKLKINFDKPVIFLLDPQSHLPHVVHYQQFSPQEGKQLMIEEIYKNWRMKNGIAFAYATKSFQDGEVATESTYNSVAFSHDGNYVPSRSLDNTLKLGALTLKKYVTARIRQKIKSWQQKGKYESTQAYRERVTETKRRELIERYTAELVDSLGRSRFKPTISSQYNADSTNIRTLYNAIKQIPSAKNVPDYDSFAKGFENREYRQKTYDYLSHQEQAGNIKGVDDNFESFEARVLGKELNAFEANISTTNYDADNQVFELTLADSSSIYVNVPVAEAPQFDQNLDRLRFSGMDFTLTSGGELVLRKAKIHNPANDQTYAYDSGREVAFNTAELAANFDPIKVEVQTEDVQTNVKKTTQKIEVGKADVDVNIPETAMSKPDGIAVVIGNRRYQGDTPDVDYAVNDAKVMRKYLIKTLGFKPGNILYEENASKSQIEVLLGDDKNQGKLANYLKPGRSDVFVFYSGHGAPDPNTETGYLIPVDGDASALNITGYPLEVLYDNLGQLDAKSVSVVIDACFSGASGGGEMLVDKASPIGIEIQNPAAQLDNGFVVTASSGSQVSSWYPEKGHGLLTYFWLKALQGEADQNGDKAITASEIRAYLNDNSDGLPYWARRLHNREQTPQVFSSDDQKVIVKHN